MLEGKNLLGYTSLFPPNEYKSNDEMMPEYFQKFKTKMSFIIRFSRKKKKKNIYYVKINKYNKI